MQAEHGQDVAEYCLITALLLLIAAGIFSQVSGGIQTLWTTANTSLSSGKTTSVPASAPVR